MKKILGLDLGTTSIGWALVNEDENPENSSIIKLGARIIQYDNFSKVDKTGKVTESKDPEGDFNSGRGLSPNADRTAKRGARRSLDRYQIRRENLLQVLNENKIIDSDFIYAENEPDSTFSSYKIRAMAAESEITLENFAKVLLMINKKRGYKSSRKAKSEDEGMAIDGMAIAKEMYENELTPGQFVLKLLKEKKSYIPDFYRSDLQNEFDKVWAFQKQFHSEILTDDFKKQLENKGLKATSANFLARYKIYTAENKAIDKIQKSIQSYELRNKALTEKLDLEVLAYVIAEINNNLNKSSGYLGAISDRSKELYFNKITVGQYQFDQLSKNRHSSLRNQIFYRQDYFDEFERIWNTQAQYHNVLTENLKKEIRDVIIFYQRKLKSQKHLISECEFEKHHKVIPKSNYLFQEFKIWQMLNNVELIEVKTKGKRELELEEKEFLFEELNIKGRINSKNVIELLGFKAKEIELNFKEIEGNNTNKNLYEAYKIILDKEGYELDLTANAIEIKQKTKILFNEAGINTEILDFDSELEGNLFDKQASYQFWHILYSIEDGIEIIKILQNKFGFTEEFAKIIANVTLQPDHGNVSARAIKKILPELKAGNKYDKACFIAGYNHSNSLTNEQRDAKVYKDVIEILPKNSLRNPVVEKILNQMINVVNAVIKDPNLGKPDEIRIELARELKKNAKEREEMSANIASAKLDHEKYRKILTETPFYIKNPTRNDIIRYKLYQELSTNGYHTLYSGTYIQAEQLFSKNFDIEHIIPKSRLFDDSFSNKTIEKRDINIKKADSTAIDFVTKNYNNEELEKYKATIEKLLKDKNISKAKYNKLLMAGNKIPDGFIDRDLRDTQYIAKKAKQLLEEVFRNVNTTTGSVTDRLRDDWGLINVMQELNFEKYKVLGLTENIEKKDGSTKERITDWTKRNDHRHHAMDALTVAFTKPAYIQYLNNLNSKNDGSKKGTEIYGIESKYLERVNSDTGSKKVFKSPIINFRTQAKEHLENVLISFKAKNKVVTKNKNKIKVKGKFIEKIQLTPRGQLHKETVYGKIKTIKVCEEKIDGKMVIERVNCVGNPLFKTLLLNRLATFENDSKKAFTGKNSLDKNPIYLDEAKTVLFPEKIKIQIFEDNYTIRKDVNPELKLDKIIDQGVKRILEARLLEFNNEPKKAFVDLDKNPIWQNEEKGIAIKKVKISGVSNAEPLHYKIDNLGKYILDNNGVKQAVDFVSTGNNHHVAIYKDLEGNLQEEIVSFYEAVARVNGGLPIINKNHKVGWEFLFTMKRNEYFVFPDAEFEPREIDLLDPINAKEISKRLFRVQSISSKYYIFSNHLETKNIDGDTLKNKKMLFGKTYYFHQTPNNLKGIIKVRINHIGNIVQVGE
jgi:CRISPR-associated endonuclease Csn1